MLIIPPMKLWAMRALANHVVMPMLLPAFVRLSGESAPIFMMHRFADPELGNDGAGAAALRENLEYLRREGYAMVSAEEMVRRIESGESIQRCVAFTVDDGYLDFATIAAPIFAAYDCPVTVFLPTGFLDRSDWFWWDKLRHVMGKTSRTEFTLELADGPATFKLGSRRRREIAQERIETWGRTASPEQMERTIRAVSLALDVPVPRDVPAKFQPMSWDDCRALESHGVSFGAHTVTHPVLSTLSDERAREEIESSQRRVAEEVRAPARIFAYPYGIETAFGEREEAFCEQLGFSSALSAVGGALVETRLADGTASRYALPRAGYEESQVRFRLHVNGVERAKDEVKSIVSLRRRRAIVPKMRDAAPPIEVHV
jgi:peptidoglycan/xylan/chitin deacetylase (PgdA/CDA1 family)